MKKERLAAFSDGVIAILITILVLELRVPGGPTWESLRLVLPHFLAYVLSFVYLGIYWNNHHHLVHAAGRINGKILWANLHLLFWLSLIPAATGWMGENHFASIPTAIYGADLLLAAVAYSILQSLIVAERGRESPLARALGRDIKGRISPVLYLIAIPCAFFFPWISYAVYIAVAMAWLIPDRRIEQRLPDEP